MGPGVRQRVRRFRGGSWGAGRQILGRILEEAGREQVGRY
jgi:hypothetical protein